MISQGISSYNFKLHVPSDVNANHNQFFLPENFKSQEYLNKISNWTDETLMQLNEEKSKYMIVNFTEKYQFNTRLTLNDKLLEEVTEKRLLGPPLNTTIIHLDYNIHY